MDAPLISTLKLIRKFDKEALNVDSAWNYTVKDYENTWQKSIQKLLESEFVEDRLGTVGQFEGIGYTHDMWTLVQV